MSSIISCFTALTQVTHTPGIYLRNSGHARGSCPQGQKPGTGTAQKASHTLPHPLCLMDPLVGFQGILSLEAFPTLKARKGLLIRVDTPVAEQKGRVGEAAAILWVGVRCVHLAKGASGGSSACARELVLEKVFLAPRVPGHNGTYDLERETHNTQRSGCLRCWKSPDGASSPRAVDSSQYGADLTPRSVSSIST